jgi:hypothetical protein
MPALAAQKFVEPFSRTRMTWIKPSFLWMMHRSAWGTKPDQEVILAIDVARDGFEWALDHATLTAFSPHVHGSQEAWISQMKDMPVRVQWDPDRDVRMQKLPRRAIQVGFRAEAVARYVDEWALTITDVSALALEIRALMDEGRLHEAQARCPLEEGFPNEARPQIALCSHL